MYVVLLFSNCRKHSSKKSVSVTMTKKNNNKEIDIKRKWDRKKTERNKHIKSGRHRGKKGER